MKVAIFFKKTPGKSQIRFVLVMVLFFFTEMNLYPSFNATAIKSNAERKVYFEDYSITEDSTFVFPNIPVSIKDGSMVARDIWHYPDFSGLALWNDDSVRWLSLSRYLFYAMLPRYINDTSRIAVVDITGRRSHKNTRIEHGNAAYYSMKIMSPGALTPKQLSDFFRENNDSIRYSYIDSLITMYVKECKTEGVNHDIAFLQMCHETGFLRFGGTVKAAQNNFCGLGTVDAATPGEWFKSPLEGVRAHIQHLKAYASEDSLNHELVDNRFYYVQRGTAPQVKSLTGKWAADPDYDHKLVGLMKRAEKHSGKPLI